MGTDERNSMFQSIKKSKFVRSVFLQIVSVFMAVVIAVIAITFFSFTTEINNSIIAERQTHLDLIEDTISSRMTEITSIAYSIGEDELFYLEPVADKEYNGYQMSSILGRYLVGNDFIEHIAYYRIAEPDTLYTAGGGLSFIDFNMVSLGFSREAAEENISKLRSTSKAEVHAFISKDESKSYFSYTYPLPKLSKNPQAYVLMLVPYQEIIPILEAQLNGCNGEVCVYDAEGNEIVHISSGNEKMTVNLADTQPNERFDYDGNSYIAQKCVSKSNGWTYVSAIRFNDLISQTANKQLLFIVLLLALMIVAIFVMLMCVIKLYNPINKLATAFAEEADRKGSFIDEDSLLSDTFATLKDDSEQKQKFENAYNEANAANKAKSAFFSNMSHDIRTPMNAIVGMTEIAIRNSDDPSYVKACLQKVRVASQYLLDIINNVLDMSRIESGKFTLSEDVIELPRLIHGIITILNQSLAVKSQHLIVNVGAVRDENVIGDNVRLTQVFMNILSNSAKFTPNGGTLTIEMNQLDSTEDGYGDYIFTFTDNGIGMSPEFTKKVFETFSRDEKSDIAKVEGTGLGMAIAKSFVELMGGTIKCESELDKGTKFTVNMHMKLAEGKKQNDDFEKYKEMSVLITGGELNERQHQMRLFNSFCDKVDYADNSDKAIEMMTSAEKPYSFVIINQSGDDISGIDAVTSISKAVESKETTFIFAAQDILSVEKSSAYNSGIAAFVQTPIFESTALDILGKKIRAKDAVFSDFAELSGLNVLLVEDNSINRLVATTQIKVTKATVFEAADGKEAVDMFKSHDAGFFDIILMDVQMPIMNGYEATAAIRSIKREDAKSVLIYAMTANTFDEDVRQVKEAGMDGHLGKPYNFEELYKILEKAYNLKK